MKRVDCSGPGIRRRRAGKGFTYHGPGGERVTDEETLARIRALAIPPAWNDVWISPHPMGHIQAIGVDAKGRKQYRYHDQWRLHRDREKFDHMLEFARALPKIRHFADEHLAQEGLTRQRVLACAVRLLDLGFFRVGSEDYAEENQTFGLATIRKKHVRIDGETIVFDYPAKSGKRRIQSVADPDVLAVVRELKARRAGGPELLAWWEGRRWIDVKSADINAYIKELTGGEFSAKDFRTWNATVLAGVALAVSSTMARSATGRKRAIARAMSEVANYLGNTPAVCRSSYVDPRIIDRYTAGSTVLEALASLDEDAGLSGLHTHGSIEEAVLDLLEEAA
ncbi:MAG: DNA topoisomerase IB [Actinobacteria bacterium]|nr:DNA topoisomerase IB [Actinomycetota bacterium]MBW3650615.1 DNA topoisomerase IB [Actinomycetota bacterium]